MAGIFLIKVLKCFGLTIDLEEGMVLGLLNQLELLAILTGLELLKISIWHI